MTPAIRAQNRPAPACKPIAPSVRAKPSHHDLVATVCAQLGMDATASEAVLQGQAFGRGNGCAYRLQPDPEPSVVGVLTEVALPLHSIELLPMHWSQLFEMQAVMVARMGWSLGLEPESGQLHLSPLAVGTSPERVVADIEIGTVLAASVLQLVLDEQQGQDLPNAATAFSGPQQ